MTFKEQIINECLEALSKENVKTELKNIMRPVIDMILKELFPYIYISIVFVFISFMLILGIFVMLLKSKPFKINKVI